MRDRTASKEFTVTLPSGKVVSAEVESVWSHDPNYGADSDGLRGMPVDMLDDLYLSVPIENNCWSHDDSGTYMTMDERREAEKLLLEKAEQDEWEEAFEVDSMEDFEFDNMDLD